MIKLDTLKALASTPQFPELKKLLPFAVTEDIDIVSTVSAYIESCQAKVCGRCSPCRIGMVRIHSLLKLLDHVESLPGDLERMIELAEYVEEASLCALGKGFPTPLLTCYKLFPEEFKNRVAAIGKIA